MKSAILTVGTEILFGQIVNTNAAYLSQQLNGLGFDVLYHFTVGDNPDRLKRALEICAKECDLIITTGGLGPTQDDLTKEVIAEFVGCRLTINQEAMDRIEGYFKRSGREMTENNVKQAYVPEGAICMQNDHGSAPGFICKVDNKKIMSFPGPPKEMMPMFENSAIHYLSTMSEGVIYSRFLKTVGIGESLLETEIMDIVDEQTDPTIATYAKDGEVTMRLTSKRPSVEEAKAAVDEMATKVHERVGNYIYTEDERSFSEVILDKMRDKGLSLSSAESCTGGLFADAFISIPGSSDVFDRALVTYSNTAKMQELGVKEETLAKFGAVSSQTAEEMVSGLYEASGSDICVAVTGLAGPGGETLEKPVGLVYTAILVGGKIRCTENRFGNMDRNAIRRRSVLAMMKLIYDYLEDR
ncbi:MAG TPA: competence/damage-inducible protein A [Candidatus Eubacterium pullicola]|nr:competence/damage-inducible protein A [Candidatus Eubacterium pullicola]